MNHLINQKKSLFAAAFVFMLSLLCIQQSTAQTTTTITLHKKNMSSEKIMAAIEEQSNYRFWYRNDLLSADSKTNMDFAGAGIDVVLNHWTELQPFNYEIIGNTIVLKERNGYVPGQPIAKPASSKDKDMVSNGYTETDKSLSTGSAEKIEGKDLQNGVQQGGGLLNNLEGRVAGVSQQRDKNGNSTLLIQGLKSFTSSSAPLIVLDGMPYSGDINMINPMNVESVTVLKDADATSIWGVRGANGVILIQTKKAEIMKSPQTDSGRINLTKSGELQFKKVPAIYVIDRLAADYKKILIPPSGSMPGRYSGRLPKGVSLEEALRILRVGGLNVRVKESG